MNSYLLIVDKSLPSLTATNWAKNQDHVIEVLSTDDFNLDLTINTPPIFIKRTMYGLVQGVIEGFNQEKYERLIGIE